MNSVQATFCARASSQIIPCVNRPKMLQLNHLPSQLCFKPLRVNAPNRICLKMYPMASKYQQFDPLQKRHKNITIKSGQKTPVCLLGGEDKQAGEGEGSPGKGIGSFNKGSSIEDVLRQQIQKGEYYEDSGSKDAQRGGRDGGRGRGGGDGGGRGRDRSRGAGDEGSEPPDEPLQVFLATFAFILLYILIVTGDEYIRLGKDYFRYLLGGGKSVRLRRFSEKWVWFLGRLRKKLKKVDEKLLLEKAIINTSTFYDGPEKYREMIESYAGSVSRDEDSDSDKRPDPDERSDSDERSDF